MKKVLLINPPFNIAKENYDSSVSVGLLSIITYLDYKGVPVQEVDGARQKNYVELIKETARECDYAGLSVMTTQIPNALAISKLIKEINPACKIIWGGAHPTFFVNETAEHPLVDIVCFGEGELTMLDIVLGKDLVDIQGIAYKTADGKVVKNPPR
ncbi:cobalamin-dependent protein, partial [Patescibacteria group bacterium]|nr:cobalamin-dependent protein [Patescibacteria group bacterium]